MRKQLLNKPKVEMVQVTMDNTFSKDEAEALAKGGIDNLYYSQYQNVVSSKYKRDECQTYEIIDKSGFYIRMSFK